MDAHVHLWHHRQAQGGHPQPSRRGALWPWSPRSSSASIAATRPCSSCRCAMPTHSGFSAPLPTAVPRPPSIPARASIPSTPCGRWRRAAASFTSLVPTHYITMLDLPERRPHPSRSRPGQQADDLLGPARQETKRAVMAMFRNSGLFELYGSTEAGWVTMLHPDEQFTKLGSVGRECVGSRPIRILDEAGEEVPTASPASSTPATPTPSTATGTCPTRPGGLPRRLLHGRRHGAARRRRLHPPRRPQEQHDHLRRRERLSVRGRGAARQPPRRAGRGRGRPA